jgi:tetratricopeptide (TPR) repeat protein
MSPGHEAPKCPECGKPSSGNFCQQCGARLGGRFCNKCGAELGPGGKFCTQCGEKVGGGGKAAAPAGARREAAASVVGGQNLPWWIAGVAMFGLIVVVGVQMVSPAGPGAPAAPQPQQPVAPFAGGGGTPPDLSSMTPREAADRLFDRVMRSVSTGDSTEAQAFLPMALSAYERAVPLDNDGLFHLSLLHRVSGNLASALGAAQEVLADDANHLLGLTAAAEAAAEMGRPEEAADYYRHLLDVLESERARALPEYVAHETIVDAVEADAEAYLAGR